MGTQIQSQAVARYADALREFPWVKGVRVARGGTELELKTAAKTFKLPVLLHKSHVSTALAAALVARTRGEKERPMILAPYIGEQMARVLTDAGLNFVDLAGNCALDLTPRYYVRIQGHRNTFKTKRAVDSALRAPSYQVLAALIARPTLINATVRDLAQAAGTSRHPASHIPKLLVEQGFAVRGRDRLLWNEARWDDLIDMFTEGYLRVLRPHLLVGHFRVADKTPADLRLRLRKILGCDPTFAWTGAAAEAELTGHYQSDRTVIHLDSTAADMARRFNAIPAQDGPLTVLGPALPRLPGEQLALAPPILVYAELLAEGNERAREAAIMIRDKHLNPPTGGE
jgi:hypothetical protein